MKSLRLSLTAAAVAGSLGLAADAAAQGFFERLFGLRPAQPVYPPQPIPQPRGPYGVPPGPAPYPGGAPPPEGELTGPSGPGSASSAQADRPQSADRGQRDRP